MSCSLTLMWHSKMIQLRWQLILQRDFLEYESIFCNISQCEHLVELFSLEKLHFPCLSLELLHIVVWRMAPFAWFNMEGLRSYFLLGNLMKIFTCVKSFAVSSLCQHGLVCEYMFQWYDAIRWVIHHQDPCTSPTPTITVLHFDSCKPVRCFWFGLKVEY